MAKSTERTDAKKAEIVSAALELFLKKGMRKLLFVTFKGK